MSIWFFAYCPILFNFLQTKTGFAQLYNDGSENACDVRIRLTKDALTIQKQDVVCVSGSEQSSNVSVLPDYIVQDLDSQYRALAKVIIFRFLIILFIWFRPAFTSTLLLALRVQYGHVSHFSDWTVNEKQLIDQII